MVLNTRNFVLYLLCVGFLLVAIVSTVQIKSSALVIVGDNMASVANADPDKVYTAEAVLNEGPNRTEKLAELKNKIATAILGGQTPESSVVVPMREESPTEEVDEGLTKPLHCPAYQAYRGVWDTRGVEFKVVEGARLIYREVLIQSSSTEMQLGSSEDVLLQLPLRTQPSITKSCLGSDVVGVALDGSLIRNNEASIYSIFSSETLVGYALDGFPIYGKNSTLESDKCGGVLNNGQYGYYLKKDSQFILNCFSGEPIKF